MGFTFDDGDKKDVAAPLAEMRRVIAKDARNAERIFPYIGGEEVNDSPTHAHRRFVINFEDWPLRRDDLDQTWSSADEDLRKAWLRSGLVPLDYPFPVAADYPDLLEIVEQRVKPVRLLDNRENYRRLWWQYGERRPGLVSSLRNLENTFVLCRVSPHLAIVRMPSLVIGADSLDFVTLDSWAAFATLQSRVHEAWARLQASSMKDDLRYTPTDCYETFPFPNPSAEPELSRIGKSYYELRASLMKEHESGLTTVYNWFHDPEVDVPEIKALRKLHNELDRAVISAYGWSNLEARCEFFPEFDDDGAEDDTSTLRKKHRYRWPDEIRDDVLARLLILNRQRALEEGHPGSIDSEAASQTEATRKMRSNRAKKKRIAQDAGEGLFGVS